MGEAKRRRDYERAHAEEIAADLAQRRAEFARIEEIAATDPDACNCDGDWWGGDHTSDCPVRTRP